MKILNLKIENVKRIKAIDITPNSNTVTLGGKNGHGKTSTIDSILMALGGGRMIPLKPVHDGEEKALIKLDLGDLIVTRKWTKSGGRSTLKVENEKGRTFKSGQDILNRLIGDLTFDPLKFATMKQKERVELLKKITGLDFDSFNKLCNEKYLERTIINRDVARLNANIEKFSEFKIIPEIKFDVDEIKKQRNEAIAHNDKVRNFEHEIKSAINNKNQIMKRNNDALDDIMQCEMKINKLKNIINKNRTLIDDIDHKIKNIENEKGENKNTVVDISAFDYRIDDYYREKEKVKEYQEKEKVKKELDEVTSKVEKISSELKKIDEIKKEKIKNAKMPIRGLEFKDEDIVFNGMLFDQLSTAEQIKISMSVAVALNPSLKIAFIHNGSLLDSDSMSEIKKIAEDNDFQVWIEKVCDSPQNGVLFIEDGEIKN